MAARNSNLRKWSVSDVGNWLKSIDLGELNPAFSANAVDGARIHRACQMRSAVTLLLLWEPTIVPIVSAPPKDGVIVGAACGV